MTVSRNKLVLFGAGKIGRSFIGQLFSRGGYEVVFIDVNKEIVKELNKRRNYNVVIRSERNEIINIKNVRGVPADNEIEVINEISSAEILAVSVGQNGLNAAIKMTARGLLHRYMNGISSPIDIIVAENMRNASRYFGEGLKKFLPADFPLETYTGIIETSIGKMVPIMLKKDIEEDILQVFAEPYNTLIVDRAAFKNPIPEIRGLEPRDNIKAWVDRKLFIHNLGHATAAYVGYLYDPGFRFVYEALAVKGVNEFVRGTMMQAAACLIKKYPSEFNLRMLEDHVDDLLCRFQNKALGDTIFRVGCDLFRKLGPEDRLAGSIRLAREFDQPYDMILFSLICARRFRAADENGKMFSRDVVFHKSRKNELRYVLKKICRFDSKVDRDVFDKAEVLENGLIANGLQYMIKN